MKALFYVTNSYSTYNVMKMIAFLYIICSNNVVTDRIVRLPQDNNRNLAYFPPIQVYQSSFVIRCTTTVIHAALKKLYTQYISIQFLN